MKHSTAWLAFGASITLALIVSWMLLDGACSLSDARGPGETPNQCYSRWISALSGWAAAIGAIVAALWTVGHIRKQIALSALRHRRDFLQSDQDFFLPRTNALISVKMAGRFIQKQAKSMKDRNAPEFSVAVKYIQGAHGLMSIDAHAQALDVMFRAHSDHFKWSTERMLAAIQSKSWHDFETEKRLLIESFDTRLTFIENQVAELNSRLDRIAAEMTNLDARIAEYEA